MDNPTKIAHRIFQIATILLLASGYGMAKIWLGVSIILFMAPYWWITRRIQKKIYSYITLTIFAGIAAFGLLSNSSAYLMVAGLSTALACWELEDQIPNSMKSSISLNARSYEKTHLQKLGMAISTGFIIAEAGLFFHIALPFGVVFLAALLVLFCIFQLFLLFKKA